MKIGIVGGTGYTGVELLRLLARHPEIEIATVTSRTEAGRPVCDVYPNLRGWIDHRFEEPTTEALRGCDLVMFATPNGVAMRMVPALLDADVRVIDLAADFRLNSPEQWEQWYGEPHACPDYLQHAVYGLPEIHRELVREARLVANPGCYPTAVLLGFLPLIEQAALDLTRLTADAKSGVSGAGKRLATSSLYAEAADNFNAYAVGGHRHHPEIVQGLKMLGAMDPQLTFVPHLAPMVRGIHATLYGELKRTDLDLQRVYEQRYGDEAFVDVLPPGTHPGTSSVRGSNICRIAVHRLDGRDRVVVLSVIDNLVKGAAGQAVQNMNLMLGFDEHIGLQGVALRP